MSDDRLRAYVDESSAPRADGTRSYSVCAAVVADHDAWAARERLRRLRLPGQRKVHWIDERESRRRKLVIAVSDLPVRLVVAEFRASPQASQERSRRKCLEVLYAELVTGDALEATLERRSAHQDALDRAHIVALQAHGLDRRLRITHVAGDEEPLLWIPDIVLGAINSAHRGKPSHVAHLRQLDVLHTLASGSLPTPNVEEP